MKSNEIIANKIIGIDTVITYDLREISTEGAEATVEYKKNKIYSAKTTIYTGSSFAKLDMLFQNDTIQINEVIYRYRVPLSSVQNKSDFFEQSNISYLINYNGELVEGGETRQTNILTKFKEQIPFVLK